MTNGDVIQIRVEGQTVGIIGLSEALEEIAAEYVEQPDQEAADALLTRLSKKNYIPDKVRGAYGKAFLRELRKFKGEPYDEETSSKLEIKVFGPGCVQCDRLERELMAVVGQLRIMADIEHVRDIKEIGKSGVMGTPALMINGRVKSVGKVPPRARLIQWLEEADAGGE